MTNMTVTDLEREFFKNEYAPRTSRDQNFMELDFFKKNSGLSQGTFADHERAFFIKEHDPVVGDPSPVVANNLVPNSSFETNENSWSQWNGNGGNFTPSRVSGGVSGSNFRRLTCSVPPTAGAGHICNIIKGLVPGKIYTISGYIRSSIAGNFYIQTAHFNGETSIETDGSNHSPISANTWTRLSFTFTAKSNQDGLQSSFYANNLSTMVAGDTFDIDSVLLTEGPLRDYFDGDSTSARWLGTPHASVSELTDPSKMSLGDLRKSYFMGRSGLSAGTITDHEYAYYKSQLGL